MKLSAHAHACGACSHVARPPCACARCSPALLPAFPPSCAAPPATAVLLPAACSARTAIRLAPLPDRLVRLPVVVRRGPSSPPAHRTTGPASPPPCAGPGPAPRRRPGPCLPQLRASGPAAAASRRPRARLSGAGSHPPAPLRPPPAVGPASAACDPVRLGPERRRARAPPDLPRRPCIATPDRSAPGPAPSRHCAAPDLQFVPAPVFPASPRTRLQCRAASTARGRVVRTCRLWPDARWPPAGSALPWPLRRLLRSRPPARRSSRPPLACAHAGSRPAPTCCFGRVPEESAKKKKRIRMEKKSKGSTSC
ncbi:hypothetical protein ACQJBY_038521 [Aegilops geniculata]